MVKTQYFLILKHDLSLLKHGSMTNMGKSYGASTLTECPGPCYDPQSRRKKKSGTYSVGQKWELPQNSSAHGFPFRSKNSEALVMTSVYPQWLKMVFLPGRKDAI